LIQIQLLIHLLKNYGKTPCPGCWLSVVRRVTELKGSVLGVTSETKILSNFVGTFKVGKFLAVPSLQATQPVFKISAEFSLGEVSIGGLG